MYCLGGDPVVIVESPRTLSRRRRHYLFTARSTSLGFHPDTYTVTTTDYHIVPPLLDTLTKVPRTMADQAAPSPKAAKPPQKQRLTEAPTNLKEAIDWVLRVTGRDGNINKSCLCFLAKAIKDLLYDAGIQYSTENTSRDYTKLLLPQEESIVKPVLQDLGLLSGGISTTCAGGTEVIKTLIDHLAQGLQKWVGWQEDDKCCLKGDKNGKSTGIGRKCECKGGGGTNCCIISGENSGSHECEKCGISATGGADKKCYLSAYQGVYRGYVDNTLYVKAEYYWPTISSDSTKVHLLARIFLGSVCLIWSGLSQLGWLTKGGSGNETRWSESSLNAIEDATKAGLGSFMAAMGYDLDRLNGSGYFLWNVLAGIGSKSGAFKEFTKGASADSVAEYYSSIYTNAKNEVKWKDKNYKLKTETLCKEYPLLVLHILASGYFRAGSAGAKGVITPKSNSTASGNNGDNSNASTTKKDETSKRPRTIREILYWLSALPYSEKYCQLVARMEGKMDSNTLTLEGVTSNVSTTFKRDDITHYLMAACGYCPLVLIGIQGTIATNGKESDTTASQGSGVAGSSPSEKNRCLEHKKDPSAKRCNPKDIGKQQEEAAKAATQASAAPADTAKLKEGEVCYGGYHLAVRDFGPLHGMYANGLFGFQMDISPAQCLDQLRIYVYHCFYQLYFLRKQCSTGVEVGGAGAKTVLGWQSCRYGSGVSGTSTDKWICQGNGDDHTKNCGLRDSGGSKDSPLMSFLCDTLKKMHCPTTTASSVRNYQEIKDHMEAKDVVGLKHFGDPPIHCPVPMGFQAESKSANSENHFKDLTTGTHKTDTLQLDPAKGTYPVHCTGNTLSHLLEYYCDPERCQSGTLVVLLRLLACITPTVPRTLGDLFGFYYYIVYIGGFRSWDFKTKGLWYSVGEKVKEVSLNMDSRSADEVIKALDKFSGVSVDSADAHSSVTDVSLKTLYSTTSGPYLSPLSGQQYGQLSPAMAGTYLSWLVYLIEGFKEGLEKLQGEFKNISCNDSQCRAGPPAAGCDSSCTSGTHGTLCSIGKGVCQCTSVVSCTGVLPVLYKYGFGYGDIEKLGDKEKKQCHHFLDTLEKVIGLEDEGNDHPFTKLITSINQLIYTTRLPWIFVLTLAWLVAVLYLAFGAIWPLDWAHMRSHCRGWFRKGSLSPWEVLMVGKKKGRGILEFFGGK